MSRRVGALPAVVSSKYQCPGEGEAPMPMIKMFASDLDGTLLNALHEADGTIRRAIAS